MRSLVRLMPTKWSILYAADVVMRSERWVRVREDLERFVALGGAPAMGMPWDTVIGSSAFGDVGGQGGWWHTNVLLPATLHVPPPPLEGMPSTSSSSTRPASPSSRRVPPRGSARRGRQAPGPPLRVQICTDFNEKRGVCAGPGPCARGRRHACWTCDGNHRGVDCWSGRDRGSFQAKGKGKDKGKNKDKGGRKEDPGRKEE
jgi:hypothetical protein